MKNKLLYACNLCGKVYTKEDSAKKCCFAFGTSCEKIILGGKG